MEVSRSVVLVFIHNPRRVQLQNSEQQGQYHRNVGHQMLFFIVLLVSPARFGVEVVGRRWVLTRAPSTSSVLTAPAVLGIQLTKNAHFQRGSVRYEDVITVRIHIAGSSFSQTRTFNSSQCGRSGRSGSLWSRSLPAFWHEKAHPRYAMGRARSIWRT